jgi:TonB family protein
MTASDDLVLESRISSLAEVSELQADICSRQLDRDAALELIVRRMIDLTHAGGAAIALREGEDVVCHASAGNAPDVGVKLSLSSLSGECFRTGAMVLLSDSENDPRVDPLVCRQLNFRSLLILPITSASDVVGIAEVLSPNPQNFEGGDVLVLSFLSDLIANIATATEPQQTHMPDIFSASMDENSLPSAEINSTRIVLASPIVQPKPEQPKLSHAAAPAIEAEVRRSAPPIGAPERHSHSPAASSRASTAVPAALLSEQVQRLPVGNHSPYSVSSDRRGLTWSLSITAALIGLLVSAGLLFSYHRRSTPTTTSPTSSAAVSLPSTPVASAPPAAAIVAPSLRTPGRALNKPSVESVSRRTPEPTKAQENTEHKAELQVIPGETAKHSAVIENAPEAPQIAQLNGGALNMLPTSVVSTRTPKPQLEVVQSQGVTGGKLLKRVMPRYPDEARRAGISGDVVLAANIGTDGMLHNLRVISGSPVLRDEALSAARQWRYIPAMLSGKPVETDTRITISFHHQ